ncbi:hypothetical protein GCM10022381_06340 [Leifsonia kafniensis]|uniref:Uncharacterized protein n=1 Tax=Leifsonia kafniensis TaxID=475957 RepID=A0ABP7K4B0_9MICO
MLAPEAPASRADQLSAAVPPSGEVAPMPVITIFLVITVNSPRNGKTRRGRPQGEQAGRLPDRPTLDARS